MLPPRIAIPLLSWVAPFCNNRRLLLPWYPSPQEEAQQGLRAVEREIASKEKELQKVQQELAEVAAREAEVTRDLESKRRRQQVREYGCLLVCPDMVSGVSWCDLNAIMKVKLHTCL